MKEKNCYFHTKLLKASIGNKKNFEGLNMRPMNISIIPSSDSRTNHLEERGKSYDPRKD
jgi:hypothetical protein